MIIITEKIITDLQQIINPSKHVICKIIVNCLEGQLLFFLDHVFVTKFLVESKASLRLIHKLCDLYYYESLFRLQKNRIMFVKAIIS